MPDDTLVLNDKELYPDEDVIFSIIGEKKDSWILIMNYMSANYKDSSGEWNFYNDGKRWLFKMVHKKKTVFWAGILPGTFRITFYLGNKAEAIIDKSDLPQKIKDDFRNATRYGMIRPVSFVVQDNIDTDNILKMIELKIKLK
jgi:hypothetical protein